MFIKIILTFKNKIIYSEHTKQKTFSLVKYIFEQVYTSSQRYVLQLWFVFKRSLKNQIAIDHHQILNYNLLSTTKQIKINHQNNTTDHQKYLDDQLN